MRTPLRFRSALAAVALSLLGAGTAAAQGEVPPADADADAPVDPYAPAEGTEPAGEPSGDSPVDPYEQAGAGEPANGDEAGRAAGSGSGPAVSTEPAAAAATPVPLGVSIGAVAGLTLSSFVGADVGGAVVRTKMTKAGFAGGGFLSYRFIRIGLDQRIGLGARVEVLVTSKGAGFDEGNIEGTNNLYYLAFPLLAEGTYRLANTPLEIAAATGLATSYLLAGDQRDNAGTDMNLRPIARDVDFGWVFDAGLSWLPGGGSAVSVRLRYEVGLRSVFASPDPTVSDDARNSTFTVMLGYSP